MADGMLNMLDFARSKALSIGDTMPRLVPIRGTYFTMGWEEPRRVWVDAFEIGAYAVTNAEYAEFQSPPLAIDTRFNHPDQPVVAVSWWDAMAYCKWRGCRL